ncbi:cell wall synthase accessory phosphoprotein MacP [Streptococcus tangpeifui]|uniref:cell wall synthase accessory phosphoprotein MacP n=1 Tax=Streptococcus tangpeifui TaxID=2709400 RepID=UPI0013ED7A63|nr:MULTISPECIES: cell wall synthase accessory phosphoprotein MacP [unclassified Streptococcus]
MGKPLLTDDMIARANRGEKLSGDYLDGQETQIFTDIGDNYDSYEDYDDDGDWEDDSQYTYKSRRIENAKRGAFQAKLNKILLIVLILLAILIYAIFKL